MAEAKRIGPPDDAPICSLELNRDEVETLGIIFNVIGGNPDVTRRGHVDNIREALSRGGFLPDYTDFSRNDWFENGQANLTFKSRERRY